MSTAKAALLAHTALKAEDCPVLQGPADATYRAAVKASSAFSLACYEFLKKKTPREQATWLKVTVDSSRGILQAWNMEILYVVTVFGRARFSQLQDLLGLSSRTLSDKLKTLRAGGLIDREVFDEQPVRIEYFPTKSGRRTAALAAPLFAHLNFEALRALGKA